ncbi:MAG: DUF5906 domain-containing protein [Phycisphaeraceae bacterium]
MPMQPASSRFFNSIVLPYNFDADAPYPGWQDFLDQTLPRTEPGDRRQQLLQEFMGYSLTRDCRQEKMRILTGEGRNGKSTLLNVWESMLGRENVKHLPFTQLGGEFRLIELDNALANFASDLPHIGRTDEGIIKQLISGEPINANRKNKSPVEIRPFAKLVVACNTLPSFVDPSLGIWLHDRLSGASPAVGPNHAPQVVL